ncbi:hypothetical protein FPOAC2_12265 [Fusarium poae]|jgi:hypothetical protein
MLDMLYLPGVPVRRRMIDGPLSDAQAMFQALMGLVILTQRHVRPKKGFISTHRGCGITRPEQQETEIYGAVSQRFIGGRLDAMVRAMPKAHVERVKIKAHQFHGQKFRRGVDECAGYQRANESFPYPK